MSWRRRQLHVRVQKMISPLRAAAEKIDFLQRPRKKLLKTIKTQSNLEVCVFLLCYFACESLTNGCCSAYWTYLGRHQTNRLRERPLTFIKTKMVCNQLGKNDTHWWSRLIAVGSFSLRLGHNPLTTSVSLRKLQIQPA